MVARVVVSSLWRHVVVPSEPMEQRVWASAPACAASRMTNPKAANFMNLPLLRVERLPHEWRIRGIAHVVPTAFLHPNFDLDTTYSSGDWR